MPRGGQFFPDLVGCGDIYCPGYPSRLEHDGVVGRKGYREKEREKGINWVAVSCPEFETPSANNLAEPAERGEGGVSESEE